MLLSPSLSYSSLTSFIGRERELADVESLLATARLVTLTGVGGAGKTRLTTQVATEVGETFADGVWLVDLAPLHEPKLVPQLVAQTLGLRPSTDQPLLKIVLSFVQSKQLLLILDNCEHLREACALLALELLSHSTDLRILATSREPLAVTGETIYPVSGLAWPSENVELGNNPKDLMQYDAVRLFVERARAISPNFSLTSKNAWPIIRICRHLDGLPLALELASARVNVLTVQEIASRLSDRFDLLISTQRIGLDPRHHTLRAAIDWSYALLTPEEQILLRRLAVFVSGCSLDTAEAVCAGEGIETRIILDLLSSLVDKSFVIAETAGRTQARYRLLETIREYALVKLDEAGEAGRQRDRHLDLFLSRSEEAEPKLGAAYQQLWLNWLEDEHDNLNAALAWALESRKIETGMRILCASERFWEIRGYLQEAASWFELFLAQADNQIPPVLRATAFMFAGYIAMFLGQISAAIKYGQEAVAAAEAASQAGGEADNPILILALGGYATGAQAMGDFQTAFAIGQRTVELMSHSSASPFLLGMSYLGNGNIAVDAGEYQIAREWLEQSLAMAQADGDAFRIAHTYTSFGDLARCQGDYAGAVAAYEKSEALLRELDARHDLPSILRSLGRVYLLEGNIERAIALFSESMAAHRAEHSLSGVAECLVGFAGAALVCGLPAAGARLLAAAAKIGGQRWIASVWPAKRMPYDEYITLARTKLSETVFEAEQEAGRGVSIEQAIDYALQLPWKTEPDSKIKSNRLTNREREIVALIAQGKTNSEIAQELVLSKRTVEKHAANILSKLGLTSRTQIVRWAIEQDLRRTSQ